VYPGDVSLSCPAIIGEPIPPHHSIVAAGTWDQRSGTGPRGAQQPPGLYVLTFDGKVRVPVRLVSGPLEVPVPVPIVPSPSVPSPTIPNAPPTPPRSPVPTLPAPPWKPVSPPPALTTRSARVGFEGCRVGQVVLSVSVPARPILLRTPLRYSVRLHNTGQTACGPPGTQLPGAARGLTVGPCGLLPVFVSDHSGRMVYPGPINYMCVRMSPIHLGPGTTASATGTWVQVEHPGTGGGSPCTSQAPPGRYRLTVASSTGNSGGPSARVVVPFSIAARTGSRPVPGPTPTIPVPESGSGTSS
jgi:hypothetical protein